MMIIKNFLPIALVNLLFVVCVYSTGIDGFGESDEWESDEWKDTDFDKMIDELWPESD